MITENIETLKKEIKQDVTIVAVTKYQSLESTRAVVDAGILDLGESRAQDFQKKYEALSDKSIRWHFIGHLQRNKVKYLIGKVFLIHSIDSLKLMKTVNKESQKQEVITNILLQLNLTHETNKYGFTIDEIIEILPTIGNFKHLKILGLMAMGPNTENNSEIRQIFVELKSIYDKMKKQANGDNLEMKILSMGMTDDYKIAIEEGSNLVRIGRKIFRS